MEQRSETKLRYRSERSTFRRRSFGSQNPDLNWLKGMQPCLEVSMRSKRFRLVYWEQKKTEDEERDSRLWPRKKSNENLPALLLAPFFVRSFEDFIEELNHGSE